MSADRAALDDDAYFADLAAGTATPASALPDPDERPGTAARTHSTPAPRRLPQTRPKPRRRRHRFAEKPRPRTGLKHALATLNPSPRTDRPEHAHTNLSDPQPASRDPAAHEPAEHPSEPLTGHDGADRATVEVSGGERLRRLAWRPRVTQILAAVAVVGVIATITAGSGRPAAGPAKARGASNGVPEVAGAADLRLGWRSPTDARPRELTLGGRLTVGPKCAPVAAALLDVLAGDQAGTARLLARVRTDAGGRFRVPVSIAGRPPRLLTVSFLAHRGDTVPAALASARLSARLATPPPGERRPPRRHRNSTTHTKEKTR
jgi:hypothetical protein